jgi:hypothetical protein
MATEKRIPLRVSSAARGAVLLGLAALLTVAALAAGGYAAGVAAAALLGIAVLWGGRIRSRHRLRTALDAFAARELTRQR